MLASPPFSPQSPADKFHQLDKGSALVNAQSLFGGPMPGAVELLGYQGGAKVYQLKRILSGGRLQLYCRCACALRGRCMAVGTDACTPRASNRGTMGSRGVRYACGWLQHNAEQVHCEEKFTLAHLYCN